MMDRLLAQFFILIEPMGNNESKCCYEARAVKFPLLRDVGNRTIFQSTSCAGRDKRALSQEGQTLTGPNAGAH